MDGGPVAGPVKGDLPILFQDQRRRWWKRLSRALQVITAAVCVVLCGSSRAQVSTSQKIDLEVHRDPLRTMISYGLVGGLAGAAVGGGVLGVMGATGQVQRDWMSLLATSAGLGLALGVVWGAVDAGASSHSLLALRPPMTDGLSFADQHPLDLDHKFLLPVFGHGF